MGKYGAIFGTFSALTIAVFPPASRAADCNKVEALELYRLILESELPAIDQLNAVELLKIEIAYRHAYQAITNQSYDDGVDISNSQSVLGYLDYPNINDLLSIYTDTILSRISAQQLNPVKDELERAMNALEGNSTLTFSQYLDDRYRSEVSAALKLQGCPSNLELDHGLPPYSPNSSLGVRR